MWFDDEKSIAAWWEEQGHTHSKQDKDRAKWRVMVLTKIDLYEVSPVMVAANDRAQIMSVKDGFKGHPFDEQLRMALAAVREVAERGRQIDAKRRESGRTLGQQRLAVFRQMRDIISEVLDAAARAHDAKATGSALNTFNRLRELAQIEGLLALEC